MDGIDFWFSIGSTYSYLTVMRLSAVEAAQGVAFDWRPFDVRSIMLEQDNIPFTTKPVKAAYMWRDIARRNRRFIMWGQPDTATACWLEIETPGQIEHKRQVVRHRRVDAQLNHRP